MMKGLAVDDCALGSNHFSQSTHGFSQNTSRAIYFVRAIALIYLSRMQANDPTADAVGM